MAIFNSCVSSPEGTMFYPHDTSLVYWEFRRQNPSASAMSRASRTTNSEKARPFRGAVVINFWHLEKVGKLRNTKEILALYTYYKQIISYHIHIELYYIISCWIILYIIFYYIIYIRLINLILHSKLYCIKYSMILYHILSYSMILYHIQ